MKNLAHTSFGAVFQTEVLLNSKRVAPYAMAILFSANALLWWGWGPASYYGWATNSEFYIVRNFPVFSFMTLPLFTALIMGDPVIRDYRTGISPLIFSKPVGRATYLLGKFCGNFFVLVCCQAAFALTQIVLQAFRLPQTITLPVRVFPYFKHFLILVVVSHLALAAIYFTVGTLTRNAKIVYALAVSFYPLYIAYQAVLLKSLPQRWSVALDPLLMNWPGLKPWGQSAEWLNQLAFSYGSDVLANRAGMILIAVGCLTILYARFSMVERPRQAKHESGLTTITLTTRSERLDARSEAGFQTAQIEESPQKDRVAIPLVTTITEGMKANLKQLAAALKIELQLLFAERSLIMLMPLATLLCVAGFIYYDIAPDGTYSAAYAAHAAEALLLFLCAIAIFYTGEAMHRDREMRFEAVLWSTPAPNFVLLLSKFAAMLLLSLSLTMTVYLCAIAIQIYKGHMPVEISAYLAIHTVILLPNIVFLIAAAIFLNVLLRDKYLAYAVIIAVGGAMFYLFNQSYNHWLFNPVLYNLWTPSDVTGAASNLRQIVIHRIYCLAIAVIFLSLAHLFYERKSTQRLKAGGRLSSRVWSILLTVVSAAVAVFTGLMMSAGSK